MSKRRLLAGLALSLCLLPAGVPAWGQDCSPGRASAELDINRVRAGLYNTGALFYESADGRHRHYEVPAGSGVRAIFAAQLWVGGMVEDELRTAAATYAHHGADFEFFPGPLDAAGEPPTDCGAYDRLYRVSRAAVEAYEQTGTATADLLEWPAALGAPVVDGDGVAGNYDLPAGDRPELVGDQAVWWVMNDAAGPHRTTESAPIGLEVQALAYAYAGDTSPLLHTTFYRYRLTYRPEQPVPLEETYVGLWLDPDLGYFGDDFIGSDPARDLGFVYNGDVYDEATRTETGAVMLPGYADRPPAMGVALLQGPRIDGANGEPGARLGMTTFMEPGRSLNGPGGIPVYAKSEEFYDYLRARWLFGVPLTYGGNGYDQESTDSTRFIYPVDPPFYWSEDNVDGTSRRNLPGDRRMLLSTGPFTMQPGDVQEIVFAIIWAQGEDRLASVAALKQSVDDLQTFLPVAAEPAAALPSAFRLGQNYPNPFNPSTVVPFETRQAGPVRLAVYDVLGREGAVLIDGVLPAGRHEVVWDAARMPGGTYFYQLEAGGFRQARPMLLVP